jgi:hypothetical protein
LDQLGKLFNVNIYLKKTFFSIRYGPPLIAQRIANFSLEAMLHLAINEFTTVEREGRLGVLVS